MSNEVQLPAAAMQRAIDHMNEDHRDSMVEMAKAFAGFAWTEDAELVGIDAQGLDLVASTGERRETARVPFDTPLTDPQGLRDAVVLLARRARQQLSGS